MFQPLGVPAFLSEARNGKKRSSVFDMLIFLAVISVAQFTQNLIITSYSTLRAIMHEGYADIALSMDYDAILEHTYKVLTDLIYNDIPYRLLTLFASITFIIAALILCCLIEKRKRAGLGLSGNALASYSGGFFLGIAMVGLAIGFAMIFKTLNFDGLSGDTNVIKLLLFLLGFCIQSFAFELFFRGYLMVTLAKNAPLWLAMIMSSLIYTFFAPGTTLSWIGILNTFLFSIFASLYMIRSGNIFGAAAMRAAFLFGECVLAGLPDCGLPSLFSLYRFSAVPAGAYVNGGAYGLEGGIAVTFVLALGVAILAMIPTKGKPAKTGKTDLSTGA